MSVHEVIEFPVGGMDCAECTLHVKKAISAVPGVETVEVFLAAEKAVVRLDPQLATPDQIERAVSNAGYRLVYPAPAESQNSAASAQSGADFSRSVMTLVGVVFGATLFVVVVGEWLGLFAALTSRIPFWVGVIFVVVTGFPIFKNVVRATLQGRIISHTLMTLGAAAALLVGEWTTAAIVVFFMRVGDYAERFTAERARRAVKDLTALAPQMARVLQPDGAERSLPIAEVRVGDWVIVRPGEIVPVDGEVVSGTATVNQATITGESAPVEAGPGARVFAATRVTLGSLKIKTTQVGQDTTFGKVIRLVEEAEAHRANVQLVADRFSAWYLPVVALIAALTFLLRRDPLATAAVLVVACSCSFALATPIAMLASIGAGARRGLMIKGGKYLELLAHADVMLVDKTGTLTMGCPEITDVWTAPAVDWTVMSGGSMAGQADAAAMLLQQAASVERYSEHPLAEAVRQEARRRGLALDEPHGFTAAPGLGVLAQLGDREVAVGNRAWIMARPANGNSPDKRAAADMFEQAADQLHARAELLASQGKTLLYVAVDGLPVGLLAAADTPRPEAPAALEAVRRLGVGRIELLTGDNARVAAQTAGQLGISYRAELLPEDKIRIVREYQAQGHTVVMVGDGVNDAPALAQADVGIAMGAAGSDIAVEAAHIALMREDWMLVPQVLAIAQRTLRVVKMNIGFTALYNLVGLSLAAFGYLPPIFAAAAQSLPDLGILANSSRLLRQK